MPSQNNIVMNISTMFEGLKGDSRQKLDNVAKLFAKTFDRFAKPLGINIDKNSIKTIEDLERKFRELGITATQVGNKISVSMKTADGKFASTSFAYEGGSSGKGKAKFSQGAVVQSASYLKPTEQLRRNYENVIKARKELDSLEQKGFSKTSDTWQKAEESVEAYNTQLHETIEALKQRYNLEVEIDKDGNVIWGNGKGQLASMGRKFEHEIDYYNSKSKDAKAIQAEANAHQENTQKVREYVSALKTRFKEEEKLVRLQEAKAPEKVIEAQKAVVAETKKQTRALKQQVKGTKEYEEVKDKVTLAEKKHQQALIQLTNTAQKSVGIFGQFKHTLKQVISAGLSWKIFSTMTRSLTEVGRTVIELDKSIVDLQIVMGSTRSEARRMVKEYSQMAQELGATTAEVTDAAVEWQRQGYNIADTNELIRNSMILSKVGMVESAEAQEYLTSAMKGYQLSVQDSLGIVDKLASVDLEAVI
jgi:hypothetical protein